MTKRYAFLTVALLMTMFTAPMAAQDDVQVERVLLTVGGSGQRDCELERLVDIEWARLQYWSCTNDSANIISRSSCVFQWYGALLAADFKAIACYQQQAGWWGRP